MRGGNEKMVNGVILVNKPTGMSSNSVVVQVRKVLGQKKVGHMGTLDPLGAGLLPIMCGKSTRLFDIVTDKSKTYRAVFRFGFETTTLDSEGDIKFRNDKIVSAQEIQGNLNFFVGEFLQMPPNFSAKKIEGRKAYDIAREGGEVSLRPKKILVTKFELVRDLKNNTFLFEIECSEGTYIRALCRDLAHRIGTYGTMCAIARTRCGGIMQIKNAFTIDEIREGLHSFIKPEELINLPIVQVDNQELKDLVDGKKVKTNSEYGEFKVFCGQIFYGVGQNNQGYIKIIRNFWGE